MNQGTVTAQLRNPEMEHADLSRVVFTSLAANGFETMTKGGVEFVLCASALTAQM